MTGLSLLQLTFLFITASAQEADNEVEAAPGTEQNSDAEEATPTTSAPSTAAESTPSNEGEAEVEADIPGAEDTEPRIDSEKPNSADANDESESEPNSAAEATSVENTPAPEEDSLPPEPLTAPTGNTVAVVVGLSTYSNLPDAVELDFARSDAATVHQALTNSAKYSHTFLVTDGEATKEGLQRLIREEVAQITGPEDTFLFYFVGHGLGADLGMPTLLTHDSTLENGQEDGLELTAFARDLQTWTRAGQTIIVTDVIHRNQLDGIYFFGPAANQWPTMASNTLILSSSQAESPGKDGAFGTVFADGISGAADANQDRFVTADELVTYLQRRMSPAGQIPVASGQFKQRMVISSDVENKEATSNSDTDAPIPAPEPVYPDTEIWSAKFVFHEGEAQSVQCRELEPKSCSPSCYERRFKAGPCDISAVIDGTRMTGRVIVLWPGKYTCGRKAGDLLCTPPRTAEPAEATFVPSLTR